jgi:hypothetical protein
MISPACDSISLRKLSRLYVDKEERTAQIVLGGKV